MNIILGFLSPSPIQLAIVALIALLLFGNRLPGVARSFGKSIMEFKKGMKEIEEDVNSDTENKDKKSEE
ncbi:MAG: twin-arginine translocase TatA/TatE family subunit [Planctomycetia bacterium]|nr:twin-arginine translocase TatA/TatE family subunit [Planctomycetia bacterium]